MNENTSDLNKNPDEFFSHISAWSQEDLSTTLKKPPTATEVAESVARANQLFDETLDSQSFSPPLACREGCMHCCSNPIQLSQPEAVLLGLYLLNHYTSEALAEVARKATAVSSRIYGLSVEELGRIRHELLCPLLMNGTCGPHPARPLVCRGWNSVDAAQCAASNKQGPMTMIESYEWPRTLADAIQHGLLRAAKEQGRETGFLRLPNALTLMFAHGIEQCVQDWVDGKPFFSRRF